MAVQKKLVPAAALTKPPMTAEEEDQAFRISADLINRYAKMVAADPIDLDVRVEWELPAPKSTMINCFRMILMVEGDKQMADALLKSGLLLAHFAPNIGPERQRFLGGLHDDKLSMDENLQRTYADPDVLAKLQAYQAA